VELLEDKQCGLSYWLFFSYSYYYS